jgi:ribonuclease P protein component
LAGAGRSDGPGSQRRLRRPSDIRRVLKEGKSHSSGRVVVYVAPGRGPSRAAWVAGRRVGGAVARNRARRLLREAWRTLGPEVEEGHNMVLAARGPFAQARAPDLTHEVEELLRRAGLIEG